MKTAALFSCSKKTKQAPVRKLHMGGKTRKEGWEVLNVLKGSAVDHVCNASDVCVLFDNNTFDELYSSHMAEHLDFCGELSNTLRAWLRVLKPEGKMYVSVPDMDVLAKLWLMPFAACGSDGDSVATSTSTSSANSSTAASTSSTSTASASAFSGSALSLDERHKVMRMMFGAHIDDYDYHYVGLNEEILSDYLRQAGFVGIEKVVSFGLFDDTSEMKFRGVRISLNMCAYKPK